LSEEARFLKILRKSKKTKTKKPHKNKDFQQIYQEIANIAWKWHDKTQKM
jgi:hypothetical protein